MNVEFPFASAANSRGGDYIGIWDQLDKSLEIYRQFLESAKKRAVKTQIRIVIIREISTIYIFYASAKNIPAVLFNLVFIQMV